MRQAVELQVTQRGPRAEVLNPALHHPEDTLYSLLRAGRGPDPGSLDLWSGGGGPEKPHF
jgi:hypothetical protein